MQNNDPEGRNFLSPPNTHVWYFFLHTFWFRMFYFISSIHYHTQWRWRRTVLNVTSLWRRNDVNLTTKLRDLPYNQCKPNSRENFLFLSYPWDNMGEIRISIPSENIGFPYSVCKKFISCVIPLLPKDPFFRAYIIRGCTWQNGICPQRRIRSAWASTQSDHGHRCLLSR